MTFAAALDAVPPYVRDVALRLVEAAGGREPGIDYPDDEEGHGWLLTYSSAERYIEVDVRPSAATWFLKDFAQPGGDEGDLPPDSIPEPLARALRSLA